MPVDSENATPVDEDANVTVMKELGLLGGEEQSSSKTTGITTTRQPALLRLLALHLAIPKMWISCRSNALYVKNVPKTFP